MEQGVVGAVGFGLRPQFSYLDLISELRVMCVYGEQEESVHAIQFGQAPF